MADIKEYIKGTIKFQYFKDNALWYKTENGFIFPVPVEETTGATFNSEDRGMFFMRWIRKYIKEQEE